MGETTLVVDLGNPREPRALTDSGTVTAAATQSTAAAANPRRRAIGPRLKANLRLIT
jgi:hypothetical protein